MIEEVTNIKDEVKKFFESNFKDTLAARTMLDGVALNSIIAGR